MRHLRSPLWLAGLVVAAACLVAAPSNASADDDTDSLFGVDLGVDLPFFHASADTALFEQPRFGGDSRLYVREDDGRWAVYRGPGYTQIVESHPALGGHAGVEILGQRIGADVGVGEDTTTHQYRTAGATIVETPTMTYEVPTYASKARLYVKQDGREYVYVGDSLDSIVSAHPDLKTVEGYPVVQKRVSSWHPVRLSIPTDVQAPPYQVEYVYQPDGVVLKTWRYTDGSWQPHVYRGPTFRDAYVDLRQQDPQLGRLLDVDLDLDIGG